MSNEYDTLLAEYKEPTDSRGKIPYMLFGRLARVRGVGGADERKPDLAEVRLIGSHKNPERAHQFVGLGWKLLKYWVDPTDPEFAPIGNALGNYLNATKSDDLAAQLAAERAKNQVLESKVAERKGKNNDS